MMLREDLLIKSWFGNFELFYISIIDFPKLTLAFKFKDDGDTQSSSLNSSIGGKTFYSPSVLFSSKSAFGE